MFVLQYVYKGGVMMLLEIDMIGEVAIYKQIKDQIIVGIAKGQLKVGDPLPPVRKLAEQLGVNAMTVNKAYGLLRDFGVIDIDRRHGAKICAMNKTLDELQHVDLLDLQVLLSELKLRGIDSDTLMDTLETMVSTIYKGDES